MGSGVAAPAGMEDGSAAAAPPEPPAIGPPGEAEAADVICPKLASKLRGEIVRGCTDRYDGGVKRQ
eukprot:12661441-Alexandrium_andersonii.AAC.1